MHRNISETPEKWVIFKLPNNLYKVFGTWSGGYSNRDNWKLNSGIAKVEEDEDYYYFIGLSGSCYKCHKKAYGTANSYGLSVLHNILEEAKGQVELMEKDNDWLNLI